MANKLLLLDDVEGLGRSGDVVSVRPGYSRNFLLPQGLAIIADKNALARQARLQEERAKRAIVDQKESEELAKRFEGLVLSKVVKIDHEGHMYGSVTPLDIVHLLQNDANIAIEKRFVQLTHPIKTVGDHEVNIRLKEGVMTSLTLKVIPEDDQK